MSCFAKTIFSVFALLGVLPTRAELTWEHILGEQTAAYNDTKVKIPFTFKNTGDHPVTLLKVKTSCSCTTAEPEKFIYQPGETGQIMAVFTIGDRRGVQEKQVRVTTSDDPAKPVVLTLKVTIQASAAISGNKLHWAKDEASVEKTLTIAIQPGTKVEILPQTPAQAKLFQASIADDANTNGYVLKVRPLSTASPVQYALRIQVTAPVRETGQTNPGQPRRSSASQSTLLVMLRID